MVGHADVKRVGTPKATEKHGNSFVIEIKLNVVPDYEWKTCFESPHTFQDNEPHPRRCRIAGEELMFMSSEKELKENIEWLDNYISQANECYRKKMEKKAEELEREGKQEAKKKEDLKRINKMLEEL